MASAGEKRKVSESGEDATKPPKKRDAAEVDDLRSSAAQAGGGEASVGPAATDSRSQQEASVAADTPQPSRLLHNCKAPAGLLELVDVETSLEEDEYLELLERPAGVCNLQLRISTATEEEVKANPARLPAVDAYNLSTVLESRLRNCDGGTKGEGGITQLDLQIGISQQLLDLAVRALYTKQLPMDPTTAEGLLLLADYLQLDCLTTAVVDYLLLDDTIGDKIMDTHPSEICQLSRRFPARDFCRRVTRVVCDRLRKEEDLLALASTMPAPGPERLKIFQAIAVKGTGAQCFALISQLLGMPDVQVSDEELQAVLLRRPELALALLRRPDPGSQPDYRELWAVQNRLHQSAVQPKRWLGQLAVDVPLRHLLQKPGRFKSDNMNLNSSIYSRDKADVWLEAESRQREPGNPLLIELHLHLERPHDQNWSSKDVFLLSPARSLFVSWHNKRIIQPKRGTAYAPHKIENLLAEWGTEEYIDADGALSLKLEILRQ